MSAESVEYDREGLSLEATGGVVLTYKDLILEGDHVSFFTKERRALADSGFTLRTRDQFIEGRTLDYYMDQRSGEAKSVSVLYNGLYLTGRSIRVMPDSIELDGASFTSCEQKVPHYKITASNMTLYPKRGILYAYWGWFHLKDIPLLPVPTYVYDSNPDSRERNVAPLPEVGENEEDGWYVIERLSWHTNPRTYGTVSLTYAKEKGPGGGVEGNFIESDDVSYNARLNTSEKDGWWGGVTYYRGFGRKGPSERLLGVFDRRRIGLSVNVSSRERINYERVSFLPDVALTYDKDDLIGGIKYDWKVYSGRIFEESSAVDQSRNGFDGVLSYEFPETDAGVLGLELEGIAQFYSGGARWGQIFETLSLKKTFSRSFGGMLGYRHVVENRGTSPYVYENYRFEPKDYVLSSAFLEMYPLRFGADLSYYVPHMDPKELDYMLTWHLGCMDVSATYRAMRKEVSFGFLLVTN